MRIELPEGFVGRWERSIGKTTIKDIKGFEESYTLLLNRGVPADEWFNDALNYVIRKKLNGSLVGEEEGGNIVGYFIRIIRNWMVYGRGNSGCWQDKAVIRLVEKKISGRTSYEQKSKIYALMGEYGSFAVYVAVNELDINQKNVDRTLEKKVPERAERIKKEV